MAFIQFLLDTIPLVSFLCKHATSCKMHRMPNKANKAAKSPRLHIKHTSTYNKTIQTRTFLLTLTTKLLRQTTTIICQHHALRSIHLPAMYISINLLQSGVVDCSITTPQLRLALNSLNSIVMCVPKTTMIVSNFHTWLWKMLKWLGQSFFITWKASRITSSNGRSAERGWFLDTKSTRDLYRKGNSMAVKLHNFSFVSISRVGKSVL